MATNEAGGWPQAAFPSSRPKRQRLADDLIEFRLGLAAAKREEIGQMLPVFRPSRFDEFVPAWQNPRRARLLSPFAILLPLRASALNFPSHSCQLVSIRG